MVVSLATLQSNLAQVFASSAIPPLRKRDVGMWLNQIKANYSSAYTSSYLNSLDPSFATTSSLGLVQNLSLGLYLSFAQSNGIP